MTALIDLDSLSVFPFFAIPILLPFLIFLIFYYNVFFFFFFY